MENENNTNLPDDNAWLDELLRDVNENPESQSDDILDDIDLTESTEEAPEDLSDQDFDAIMQEALSEAFQEDITEEIEIPSVEQEEDILFLDEDALVDDAEAFYDEEYDEAYDDEYDDEYEEAYEEEEEEPEDPNAPVRKVRPKAKKGYGLFGLPHIASTIIWLLICISIGVSLGRLAWICAADVLAFGRPDQTITITITEEDTIDTIANKLHAAGLIEYKELFKLYAALAKADQKISAGTYVLNSQYDYHALVSGMSATSSYRETIKVVIPEGYTSAQIYELLESKGVCSVKTLEEYASTSQFANYEFLEGVPRGSKYCLEGFLFPDTYEFYTNDTPQRIFDKLLSRFDDQFNAEMRSQIDALNQRLAQKLASKGYDQTYIDEHKLNLYDVVILASIVQKESAHSGENHDIAGVFFNRLGNPGLYPKLESEATVIFAQQYPIDGVDTLNNPYNTYVVEGLPIGPIANPGMLCLKAALDPTDHAYHFMLLNPDTGDHLLAKDNKEHEANKEQLGMGE